MNPYRCYEGKKVRVHYIDFGKIQKEEGILQCRGYKSMICVGNMTIGTTNVCGIWEIE